MSDDQAPIQKKYVVLSPAGNPMAFYDSVLSPPPENSNAVEISTAIWSAWIVNTTGLVMVNGALQAVAVPAPTQAQQAWAIIAGGLAITSASQPAINGQYACDNNSTDHIQAEMLSIIATKGFADGGSTVAWPDVGGAVHVFPNVATFTSFAVAVAAFVAAGFKVANGTSSTLPSAAVSIP